MGAFAVILAITWVVGGIVTIFVRKARSGLPLFDNINPFKLAGGSANAFAWFFITMFAAFVWPIWLVAWIGMGKPEPGYLWGEKAHQAKLQAEREARERGDAAPLTDEEKERKAATADYDREGGLEEITR